MSDGERYNYLWAMVWQSDVYNLVAWVVNVTAGTTAVRHIQDYFVRRRTICAISQRQQSLRNISLTGLKSVVSRKTISAPTYFLMISMIVWGFLYIAEEKGFALNIWAFVNPSAAITLLKKKGAFKAAYYLYCYEGVTFEI